MTPGTKSGRLLAVRSGPRVVDVVDAMAVGAYRRISVSFLYERLAVDAVHIFLINRGMAGGAGLGDLGLGLPRMSYFVEAMTIGANRCLRIAPGESLEVLAVQRLGIFGKMTPFANFILGYGILPSVLNLTGGVRVGHIIEVAIRTGQLPAVD